MPSAVRRPLRWSKGEPLKTKNQISNMTAAMTTVVMAMDGEVGEDHPSPAQLR